MHFVIGRHESFRRYTKCALVPGILDGEEVVFRCMAHARGRRRKTCLAEVHMGAFDALVPHAEDGLPAVVTVDIWVFNLLEYGLCEM